MVCKPHMGKPCLGVCHLSFWKSISIIPCTCQETWIWKILWIYLVQERQFTFYRFQAGIDLHILHILIHSESPVVGTVPVHCPGNSLWLPSFIHHLLGKIPCLLPIGIYHSLTLIPHAPSSPFHHSPLSKMTLLGTLPDPSTQTRLCANRNLICPCREAQYLTHMKHWGNSC